MGSYTANSCSCPSVPNDWLLWYRHPETGGGGCCRGALTPVNGGLGSSWTSARHLRPQSAGRPFQTLSPVTRETLAATRPPPQPPPLVSPDITSSLEVVLGETMEVFPAVLPPNGLEGCKMTTELGAGVWERPPPPPPPPLLLVHVKVLATTVVEMLSVCVA